MSLLRRLLTGASAPETSLVSLARADPALSALGEQLLLLDAGLGLFRLAHLHGALRRRPRPRSILSIGSGGGLHEAFLARLFPSTTVVGVDRRPPIVDPRLPNLSFVQGDLLDAGFTDRLRPADFVYSIECLEHIERDEEVAAAMAALVRPGGALYVQVPFASADDLADPVMRAEQLRLHEHVRPGYTAEGLGRLCERNGLTVSFTAGAFWFPIQQMVWLACERYGTEPLRRFWPEMLALALGDVRPGLPTVRTDATAIKVMAVRP